MAGIFVDSFDHYADGDILTKWSSRTTGLAAGTVQINASAGRNATSGIRIAYSGAGNSAGPELRSLVFTTSGATVIAGFALTASVLAGFTNGGVLTIYDGTTAQISLRINADGTFSVLRGLVTGTVVLTTSGSISTGTSNYIEMKVLIDPSVGTAEVKINGASAGSASSLNTRNSSASQWNAFSFGKNISGVPGATSNLDIDDFYICDGSGSVNNTYLGDVRIKAQLPSTGNGTNVDFTPSTGTDHGALVDESTPNTSDYNSSSTAGQRDTYNFPTLGLTGTVKMLQTCLFVGKSDAGTRTVARVHRISGVNYDGTSKSPSTSFLYMVQLDDQSPATSTAWTTGEINGAETGIKLVS